MTCAVLIFQQQKISNLPARYAPDNILIYTTKMLKTLDMLESDSSKLYANDKKK